MDFQSTKSTQNSLKRKRGKTDSSVSCIIGDTASITSKRRRSVRVVDSQEKTDTNVSKIDVTQKSERKRNISRQNSPKLDQKRLNLDVENSNIEVKTQNLGTSKKIGTKHSQIKTKNQDLDKKRPNLNKTEMLHTERNIQDDQSKKVEGNKNLNSNIKSAQKMNLAKIESNLDAQKSNSNLKDPGNEISKNCPSELSAFSNFRKYSESKNSEDNISNDTQTSSQNESNSILTQKTLTNDDSSINLKASKHEKNSQIESKRISSQPNLTAADACLSENTSKLNDSKDESLSKNNQNHLKCGQHESKDRQNDSKSAELESVLINEDTCSSNSRLSVHSTENSDSDDESKKPARRRLPKKGDKSGRIGLKKRLKTVPEKLITTHKLKTDDINQIQITMTTTEKMKESKMSTQKRSEVLKNYIDAGKMTYRVMKRANFVIETVRQEKVIVDLTKLMKLIKEEEAGEGYKATIDKKSLMRLILKLSRDGYIKFRKATLKSDSREKCVCFICHPNIDDDHSVIISALEQSKMKFFIGTKDSKSKDEPMLIEEKDLPSNSKNMVKFIDLPQQPAVVDTHDRMRFKYDRNASKSYGLCPKFVRTRIMHKLLYYLIYEEKRQTPITDREEIDKVFQDFGIKDDVFENHRYCPIYNRELNWKIFVPPLPVHESWPRGWTLICDVLLRLPISIFLKCFNVPYIIPDVKFYMDHPVRKYFLVKNLPPKIRNGLMHGRRYIFAMHELVSRLCHMGLLQFGPQKLKEKDQVFVYLNKRASLYNTVTSPPGYHQVAELNYEKHEYIFNDFQDVETYWYELWTICINTNLGTRTSVAGQFIVLEQAQTKPALMEASKPHLADEVDQYDTGSIPGDGRGAAGLDSALFPHLKRNWNWSDLLNYPEKQAMRKIVLTKNILEQKPEEEKAKIKVKTKIETKIKPKKFKVKGREAKRKKIIRHVMPKKLPKAKKPMYDEKDKMCLKKMSKLRTDWTQIEDNVLLLCMVASIYLCPNRRRQNVEYTVMRDVLHKMVSYSNDKTSRSCQRRISYIMKNIKTRRSVQMCLEEIRQCEFVTEKFGAVMKKYHGLVAPTLTLNIAFIELVAYMNRRFSNQIPTTSKPLTELPDTVEEIRRNYEFNSNHKKTTSVFKDVENVHDINFDVVRSVIHSSLCCSKDKTSWAFQLFKIYQQYPEGLLRSVISKIRHDQMISVKKTYVKAAFPTGCLPFSSPFQLSISYAYQLQNTRLHYDSYNEANMFLRSILQWLGNWEKNSDSLEILTSDNGTSMLILDVMEKLNIEFKFEHPEQVIVLDPVITNDKAYDRIVKRYNEILKDPARIKYWEENHKPENDDEEDDENYPDFNNEQLKSMDSNSTMIRRSSTRIAFHMMRAEMCEGIDKNSAQHIHDYFVVNASKVFLKIPANAHDFDWTQYELTKVQSKLNALQVLEKIRSDAVLPDACGRITTEEVKSYFSGVEIMNNDVEFIEKVKCFIYDSGEMGTTVAEIKNITPDSQKINLTHINILDLLQNLKIIIRVGITTPRFVHFDHKNPWIVNSDKIVRLEKEKMNPKEVPTSKWKGKRLIKSLPTMSDGLQQKIKLLVAPWIRLDGSLNRRVLDRWMGSIISYIIEEPGISLQELTTRYDYLKPIEVMYLVEILANLKSIKLIKIIKPKVTLFSKEADFGYVEASVLDEPRNILIEPTQDVIFRFSVFLGNKSYGANFID